MIKRVPALDSSGLAFPKTPKVKRGKRTPSPDAEKPPVPIELEWDPLRQHMRWKVIDPDAWTEIRMAVESRSGLHCEGCNYWLGAGEGNLHHVYGRGMGSAKRCDCPDCLQLLCVSDSVRLGCHDLVHKAGKLKGKFTREAAGSVGESE
jgi:hypothetical protein